MRLIDADALYDAFERTPWMDNADRDIAEEVAENAPTVNPWVKSCDRLPDDARWVLGARRDDVREMRYRRNGMQSYWDKPSVESPDPIYWREMPQVPKEENHEI